MKTAILSCLLIAIAASASASHENKVFMKRPAATWSNYPAGIKDVEIDVTPLGVYALIDLTFSIGPTLNPAPTDSQEAVIFFDLPAGSYVHDSWLWLNSNTIISAELMERRKASEVYANIVRRRRDLSLLSNVLPQGYQLNIYPVARDYWRKVKITYSTPVIWQGGRANVPLPMDLLAAAQTPPSLSLNVHTNGAFYNPRFTEQAFGSWLTGQSGNSQQLTVPASGYIAGNDLTLSYEHYHQVNARLSVYPTGINEGIYELVAPPAALPSSARYFNFVIDHQPNSEIYSLPELRRMMHNLLTTSLSAGDYFNIYYRSSAGIVTSVFSTWHVADSTGISGIAPAFAGTASPSDVTLGALLKSAMLFTATGPAAAETIILNGNYLPMSTASSGSFMATLRATPGIFSRKARIIDYRYSATPGQANMPFNANVFHDFLDALADSTNGTYTPPDGFYYDSYTQSSIYDINMRDVLRQTLLTGLPHTGVYNVRLPLTGFTYSEHNIGTDRYYTPYTAYTETGRYYGVFNAPDSVQIDYSSPGGMMTGKTQLTTVSAGDSTFRKTWNYYNNKALAAYGNSYKQEIIDSSIRNRVLSDFTAFLALETGDTIRATVGQSSSIYTISVPSTTRNGVLTAYPIPFRNQLTIECTEPIEEIKVFSITGSLLLTKKFANKNRLWIWDGRDNSGHSLPSGIYLIRATYNNDRSEVIRINKLDG